MSAPKDHSRPRVTRSAALQRRQLAALAWAALRRQPRVWTALPQRVWALLARAALPV